MHDDSLCAMIIMAPQYNHSNGSRPPSRKPTNSATARNTSSNHLRLQKADALSFSSKQSSHQTKRNNKKLPSTGFKQQPICTPLAPTRNQIIYKTASSDLADRTRHGPYNCVSGEKQKSIGHVWSKNSGKSSRKTNQTNHKRNQKRPANPPARFAFRHKAKQRSNKERGRAQQKPKQKLEICLGYSDLSHCIIVKNMQTN